MRPVRIISALGFAAALAVTGCAAQRPAVHPSAAPAAVADTPVTPAPPVTLTTPRTPPVDPRPAPKTPTAPQRLYFETPQAAMRYLTVAYNHNDLVALGHVTTPIARANLVAMHRTAVNLQLVGCAARPALGDYTCAFTHDFPPERHLSSHGQAHFIAAPADKHGWYMTVLEDCD
jgi:hypothetical protein